MSIKVMINGREFDLPEPFVTGEELRSIGNIDPERMVVLQRPTGNYMIEKEEIYPVQDGDYFSDAPVFRYG